MSLVDDPRWPALGLLGAALVLGLLVWWGRRPSPEPHHRDVLVAHTARLRELPRFRALVRARLWRTAARSAFLLVAAAGCLVLVARPTATTRDATVPGRDVVLCLDASGSMSRYNEAVVGALEQVADGLPGDRFGLWTFDGVAVMKFPLTDDAGFVADRLEEAQRAFARDDVDYRRTAEAPFRSSQLGDGLLSCIQGFDRVTEARNRIVLVATDNEPLGERVRTLEDAAAAAATRDVVIEALGVESLRGRPSAEAELRDAVGSTGGSLAYVGDADAVPSVVSRIAGRREAPPSRVVETARDVTGPGVLLVVLGVAGAVLSSVTRRP
ncbi:vWA domain-containing protein [Nocardioides sp. NPDC092400]|uniref:vWA domain-containing protein n=1 Tax=Nocardioides sp. NPDC092400 TaxID=3155196 RepID=UPI003444F1B1